MKNNKPAAVTLDSVSRKTGEVTERTIEVNYVDHGAGSLPVLEIEDNKGSEVYQVEEFQPDREFIGRAFQLHRNPTAKRPAETYSVLVCRNLQDVSCDCAGFTFGNGKPCKHIAALRYLVEGGLLDQPCADRTPEPHPTEQQIEEEAEVVEEPEGFGESEELEEVGECDDQPDPWDYVDESPWDYANEPWWDFGDPPAVIR